jgi:hypothetical protein
MEGPEDLEPSEHDTTVLDDLDEEEEGVADGHEVAEEGTGDATRQHVTAWHRVRKQAARCVRPSNKVFITKCLTRKYINNYKLRAHLSILRSPHSPSYYYTHNMHGMLHTHLYTASEDGENISGPPSSEIPRARNLPAIYISP